MHGLVKNPGTFRTQGVEIGNGDQVAHVAPRAWNVENLMNGLFNFLKNGDDNLIIKSCVFHYEMEFIHPFMDGNGRLGRLWQTVILIQENPVFEYLPIEHEIKSQQLNYYDVLSASDKQGVCTVFIEYMLRIIMESLNTLIAQQRINLTDDDRIQYFKENFQGLEFARNDYLDMFKDISTATATRDVKKGLRELLWTKVGDNRTTRYIIK